MQWYSPWVFLLLFTLPALAYLLLRKNRTAAVKFPSLGDMKLSWTSDSGTCSSQKGD